LAQALYLTRQQYRRTVASGVDNNIIVFLGIVWLYSCNYPPLLQKEKLSMFVFSFETIDSIFELT
jgi:hypothetical protein